MKQQLTGIQAAQFLFLSLAIIAAGARTFTRIYRFKRITPDDCFLILACVFFAASTGVVEYGKTLVYTTTYINLGLVIPPSGYPQAGLRFSIIDNIVTIFVWAALFCVKISFVLFFGQLIQRVRHIKIWWWVVFVIVCSAAPVNMFMGFYICPDFTLELQQKCSRQSIIDNTKVYLWTSCILDIITDMLVLSIPIALLWKVRIDLRRKMALLTVLCLSVFMIIISIVRIAFVHIQLPNGRGAPDTPWLFFWQNIEAATAIIMVSVTAFRSMLGQAKTTKPSGGSSAAKKYISIRSRQESDLEPLSRGKTQIVKTTEVVNSYDDKSEWPRSSVSQPLRSYSPEEQHAMTRDRPRDWSRERLPNPASSQYETHIRSSVDDRRYDESSSIELA